MVHNQVRCLVDKRAICMLYLDEGHIEDAERRWRPDEQALYYIEEGRISLVGSGRASW